VTAALAAPRAGPRAPSLAWLRPPLVLGLLAFLLYLQPAVRVVQLNPDVVEYVDVARRLVGGEGFRLGVKAYHFGGTDVLHHGLAELFPQLELPDHAPGDYQTLSGLAMARLSRIPGAGDRFEWAGLRFEILDMDGNRVDKVLLTPAPAEPGAEVVA
jgi:hypothetical protein